ncbi:MAG: hypothetical protein JJT76_08845 [Clostridiaceae bacterium]|nr:hypothetical protein [Clostridiaceae bacterium]
MGAVALLTKELEKVLSFFPMSNSFLRLYYKNIVEREISLGEISSKDKVLCIGGGSFPCTAMEIASRTGAYVQVIDMDPCAVENSKRLIKKLDLSEKVKVIKASGEEVDPSGFSVVHVALQAYPQDKIVKNLLKNSENNIRILVRSPKTLIKSFYKSIQGKGYCSKCEAVQQKYSNTKATLLFIKDEERLNNEKTATAFNRNTTGNSNILAG